MGIETMLKVNPVSEWWRRGMAAETRSFWQLSLCGKGWPLVQGEAAFFIAVRQESLVSCVGIESFSQLVNRHLLNSYYVQGTVLSTTKMQRDKR